jgi:hypothetical protein
VVIRVPLIEVVSFKCALQKGNRVQVPKLLRWQFKLETTQVLKVTVNVSGSFGNSESFYARMSKDGRITVPWLAFNLLQKRTTGEKSLRNYALEVKLEPAQKIS